MRGSGKLVSWAQTRRGREPTPAFPGYDQVTADDSRPSPARLRGKGCRSVTGMPIAGETSEIVLVCDACGRTRRIDDIGPGAWGLLWLQATKAGWRGSDRAFGPHYCVLCIE
jgi:hypothetical protein